MSAPESRGDALQGLKSSQVGEKNGFALNAMLEIPPLEINDLLQQLAVSYSVYPCKFV